MGLLVVFLKVFNTLEGIGQNYHLHLRISKKNTVSAIDCLCSPRFICGNLIPDLMVFGMELLGGD